MYKVIAILGLLFVVRLAHADGVAVCGDSSKAGLGILTCLDSFSYQPSPAPNALILTCQSSSVQPGLQDMATCPVTVWKTRPNIVPSELVGWCAQANMTPFTVCNSPDGKEGYRLASDIWGSTGSGSTGSAVLSWTPVTVNSDGAPATITGYRVEYGQSDFAQSVTTPGLTQILTLPAGTWQFRVVAIASYGESIATKPVTFAVVADSAPPAAPTVALSATPASITAGMTSSLSWTSVNATSCQGIGAATSGTVTVTPQSTISYSQTCTGPGGTATASATITVAPAAPEVWTVAPVNSGTRRPVYEAVLPLSGSGLVRGNADGSIAAGKPCGAEVFKEGSNSYRSIANSDAQLNSPTYSPRSHVTVCVKN